uniref:Uncharacterized protein n=1 Tax=Lepeophtheirus salmonis TaxID=72036 RepID=A0A0K2SVQ5_LEPSM
MLLTLFLTLLIRNSNHPSLSFFQYARPFNSLHPRSTRTFFPLYNVIIFPSFTAFFATSKFKIIITW